MLGAFRKIGEILVRQVAEELLHVLASQLDEVAAHAIADAPRTAVQHEPDHVRFIETNLDEVVAGSQRSEEHTSELQSRLHLVCRLLLEKKKKNSDSSSL